MNAYLHPMRRQMRPIVWALGLILAFGGYLNAQTSDQNVLRREMDSICAANGITRFDFVIVDTAGVLSTGQLGDASLEINRFRMGSLGKTIVALGIMKLVEDSKLDLDDPISELLPNLTIPNAWESSHPLKLVHLLEHTSGLDEMHFKEFFRKEGDVGFSLVQILQDNLHAHSLRWEPGTRHSYSNLNYALAGAVLEAATGQRAGDWLKQEILFPMGMKDSYFSDGIAPPLPKVELDDNEPASEYHEYLYYSSAGFVSTIEDLGKLVQFFLRNGQIAGHNFLSVASIDRMGKVESTLAACCGMPDGYGLGLKTLSTELGPLLAFSGAVEGSTAAIEFMPSIGRGFAFAMNKGPMSQGELEAFEVTLFNYCLKKAQLPPKTIFPPLKCAVGSAPELGYYQLANTRNNVFSFFDYLQAGIWLKAGENDKVPEAFELETVAGTHVPIMLANGQNPPRWGEQETGLQAMDDKGNAFLQFDGKFYEKTSNSWPGFFRLGFAFMRGLRWFGLTSMVILLLGYLKKMPYSKGILPLAIVVNMPYWCAHFGFKMLASGNFYELGRLGLFSITLLVLSLLLIATCLLGLWLTFKAKAVGQGKYFKILFVAMALMNLGLMGYLMAFGMLPFASWRY